MAIPTIPTTAAAYVVLAVSLQLLLKFTHLKIGGIQLFLKLIRASRAVLMRMVMINAHYLTSHLFRAFAGKALRQLLSPDRETDDQCEGCFQPPWRPLLLGSHSSSHPSLLLCFYGS
jgi:hypothetical protein